MARAAWHRLPAGMEGLTAPLWPRWRSHKYWARGGLSAEFADAAVVLEELVPAGQGGVAVVEVVDHLLPCRPEVEVDAWVIRIVIERAHLIGDCCFGVRMCERDEDLVGLRAELVYRGVEIDASMAVGLDEVGPGRVHH